MAAVPPVQTPTLGTPTPTVPSPPGGPGQTTASTTDGTPTGTPTTPPTGTGTDPPTGTGTDTGTTAATDTDTTTTPTTATTPTTTTTSTTTSTTPLTTSDTSTTPPPVVTTTSTSTNIVTAQQPSTSPPPVSSVPAGGVTKNLSSGNKTFFDNKAAVAGVFTVVGLVVVVVIVFLVTNIIRRRRARKFDDEVSAAAMAAQADADRGAAHWQDEDDNWPPPASRAYTNSSGGGSGSFGAHNTAPMPVSYSNHSGNHLPYEQYRDNPSGHSNPSFNPFGDSSSGYPSGVITPGLAGVGAGAAGAVAGHEMRQRGPVMSPASSGHGMYDMGRVDDGISYDSGRYPVPPGRARSVNYGNEMPGRSLSMSSSGHSHNYSQGRYGAASPPPLPPKLAGMAEQDDDPYDGMDGITPETERSDPHGSRHHHADDEGEVEDAPRMLRVANA